MITLNLRRLRIGLLLMILFTVQVSEVVVMSLGGRSLRAVYVLGPPVLVLYMFTARERYALDRYNLSFIGLNAGIVLLLLMTHPLLNVATSADHLLHLFLFTAVAIEIHTSNLALRHVGTGFFLGAIPILLLDILAIARVIQLDAKVGYLGITGGIGPEMGFGAHGVVMVTGLFGGWLLLRSREWRPATRTLIGLLMLSFVGMILFSQSRSGLLSLLIATSPIAVIYIHRQLKTFDPVVVILFLSAIGSVSIGSLLALANSRSVYRRFDQVTAGLDVFLNNLAVGIGWNQFHPFYYEPNILHFTPLNYFVAAGLATGIVYMLTLVLPVWIFVRATIDTESPPEHLFVLFGMYMAIIIELTFARFTPSAHHLVVGVLLIGFCIRFRRERQYCN